MVTPQVRGVASCLLRQWLTRVRMVSMNVVSVGGGETVRFTRAPFSGIGFAEAILEVRIVSNKIKEVRLGKCMMSLQ